MAEPSWKSRPRRAAPRLLRRFVRAQDGATAVEFALVALPFMALVFGLIELGLILLVSMTLENALASIDRKIRTGEFQTNNGTAASYRGEICGQMPWLGAACASALTVDVRSMSTFTDTTTAAAPNLNSPCWDPGGPNSIILVRAWYRWPLITPLLSNAVFGDNGAHMVTSAAVFTNEPYSDTPAPSVICPS